MALTGQTIPIVQAPIGSAAAVALAGAVSRAGGLGGVGLSWSDPEETTAIVRSMQAAAGGHPVYGNFVLHFPCEGFDAALDAGLAVVTLSFGIDAARVARAQRAGARVGIMVGSRAGARLALEAGADFLIAQGLEAGGHVQSTTPGTDLLPAVLDEVGTMPVLAAGGIATAEGIARVLATGAAGAVMGTRFIATAEAGYHDDYKTALVAASGTDTVLTNCFDLGWPYAMHRVLRNDTFNAWEAAGCPQAPNRPGEDEIVFHNGPEAVPRYADMPPLPDAVGSLLSAALYSGTGVGDIRSIEPAGHLMARFGAEMLAQLETTP
jgi:NAD(P)H-dependent flavin oxidoreductase YrpB (nitropropane dioxygenase family)